MPTRHLPQRLSVVLLVLIVVTLGCAPASSSRIDERSVPSGGAAIPEGFRRTAFGWEDASNWEVVRDDPELVEHWLQVQRLREPKWARDLLGQIRSTSPLTVAFIQIAVIACIFRVGQRRDPSEASKHGLRGRTDLGDQ